MYYVHQWTRPCLFSYCHIVVRVDFEAPIEICQSPCNRRPFSIIAWCAKQWIMIQEVGPPVFTYRYQSFRDRTTCTKGFLFPQWGFLYYIEAPQVSHVQVMGCMRQVQTINAIGSMLCTFKWLWMADTLLNGCKWEGTIDMKALREPNYARHNSLIYVAIKSGLNK